MRGALALVVTLTALPLVPPAAIEAQSRFAQPARQAPPAAQMRFRGMDQNDDGIITRAEWRGSAQSFDRHDWNRDGVLSGDEVRVGARRGNRRLDAADREWNSYDNWTQANFDTLDRNRDGRIAGNEWRYDYESFRWVDQNGDGALSRGEFLGNTAIDDDREDRFEYLDADRDGRIERREWHGSGETFEWLDRNRDDVLSLAEVTGNTGARTAVGTSGQFGATGQIVRVQPTARWTDTGLDVRVGDRLTFDATGTMELSLNGNDSATPAGARSGRTAESAPLKFERAGALIARIGESSTPLLVGAQRTIERAPLSGRLYLGVNDDHLPDNSGEYRVSVTIERR